MQDKMWINKLNSENKGLWSLIYPCQSNVDINKLAEDAPVRTETTIIHFAPDNISAYESEFYKGLKQASLNERNSLWVYIINFDELPADKQCAIVRKSRSFQEENKLSCKFIFCGSWNYYVFKDAYLHIYGKTNSPPLQSKDIIRVPPATAQDIIDAYNDVLLIPKKPSRLDNIYLNFFIEQTGGDFFLINKSIEHLRQIGQDWKSNIEQVLSELVDSESVTCAIQSRLILLDLEAKSLLIKLLLFHRLIRNLDDSAAEQLWVAGIIKSADAENGKRYIRLASPIVEVVVRNLYHHENSKIIAPPQEICFDRSSSNVEAFCLIAEIETLLRNIIFTMWYKQFGEEWYTPMNKIKTSRNNSSNKAQSQETLYKSAQDWRKRQTTHHSVELASQALMQFLTTEALVNILQSKHGFNCPDKFIDKRVLYTKLDEYTQIRSSVAHNRIVKISTIKSLQDILKTLVYYISLYADQTTETSVNQPLQS